MRRPEHVLLQYSKLQNESLPRKSDLKAISGQTLASTHELGGTRICWNLDRAPRDEGHGCGVSLNLVEAVVPRGST
jgi:hypothetical protein